MDLSQLQVLLAGLGPWGILIGAGLTLVVQWWRNRQPSPAPSPAPTPPPAPSPLPSLPDRPILNGLLQLLLGLLQPKPAPGVFGAASGDLDPATALKVMTALKAVDEPK